MSGEFYVLDEDGRPLQVEDALVWGQWFQTADRTVANDHVGEARISTVFLGLDHNHDWPAGAPILWETMIFGGPHDGYCERYSSRIAAIAGHAQAMALVTTDAETARTRGAIHD
jgi:hypothetical protein